MYVVYNEGIIFMCSLTSTTATSVFQKFYSDLVDVLPMDDATFRARLFSKGLLPGDLKNTINASSASSAEKTSIFLDRVIEPSVKVNDVDNFNDLLNVMKDFTSSTLKNLSKTIKLELNQSLSKGMFLVKLEYMYEYIHFRFRECRK